jgi:hypothetical protein
MKSRVLAEAIILQSLEDLWDGKEGDEPRPEVREGCRYGKGGQGAYFGRRIIESQTIKPRTAGFIVSGLTGHYKDSRVDPKKLPLP